MIERIYRASINGVYRFSRAVGRKEMVVWMMRMWKRGEGEEDGDGDGDEDGETNTDYGLHTWYV